jgi:hypothetical protein
MVDEITPRIRDVGTVREVEAGQRRELREVSQTRIRDAVAAVEVEAGQRRVITCTFFLSGPNCHYVKSNIEFFA